MSPPDTIALDPTDWLIAAAAIATAILAIWRVVIPAMRWARHAGEKANRAFDVVLGSPAIADPDRPGVILKAETRDIGMRVTSIEAKLDVAVLESVAETRELARTAHLVAGEALAQATAAIAAAEEHREILSAVEHLPEQVEGLREEVARWHGVDKIKADLADALVHEMTQHPTET